MRKAVVSGQLSVVGENMVAALTYWTYVTVRPPELLSLWLVLLASRLGGRFHLHWNEWADAVFGDSDFAGTNVVDPAGSCQFFSGNGAGNAGMSFQVRQLHQHIFLGQAAQAL